MVCARAIYLCIGCHLRWGVGQKPKTASSRDARAFSFNTPRVRAVQLLYPPLLDGSTHGTAGRAAEKIRRQSDKAVANGRGIESKECRRSFECGSAGGLNLELEPLLLSASPFNGWFNMVDVLSKPTATPLRSPPRALPEMCLVTSRAREKTGVGRCEPSAVS